MPVTQWTPMGSPADCDVASQMERLARYLWRGKQGSINIVTTHGGRMIRVRCTGYSVCIWEELA